MDPVDLILHGHFYGIRILFLIGGALLAVAILFIAKSMSKVQNSSHTTAASCACGWSGQVGLHARRCPKCNSAL